MDISIVGKNSIKIKGKQVTFIVDPAREMPKTQANAIILLNGFDNVDAERVADLRIIINGQGGYEVGGAKISGTTTPEGILYKLLIDDVSIILGRTTESKIEGLTDCQIAIINAGDNFSGSFVATMDPMITVLYGNKKEDAAKKLGAESLIPVAKITVVKDKLPEKTEIIVMG